MLLQLGGQRCAFGGQPAQFGLVAFALLMPGLRRLTGDLSLLLQQLVLAPQAGQFALLLHLDLADLGQLGTAGVELSEQACLAQLGVFQALLQQRLLALRLGDASLQRPETSQQRNKGRGGANGEG